MFEAGYAVSSNGKIAPIITVSGTGAVGASYGFSGGASTAFYNVKNVSRLKEVSRSYGGGGSIGGIHISGKRVEGFDVKDTKQIYSGGKVNIGIGPKWEGGLSFDYTFVGKGKNIKGLFE